MSYEWNFSVVWQSANALLQGLWVSIQLTAISGLAGILLGIIGGGLLSARNPFVRWPVTAVVEIIRAVPLPALLVYFYYVGPIVFSVSLPSFATSAIAFSLSFGGFAADVFRGSIQAIPAAHLDMAAALGMSRFVAFRRVIATEAFRRSFPSLNGMLITLLKLTGLAALINTNELVYTAGVIVSDRPRVFEIYTAMTLLYLAVVMPSVYLLRALERSRHFALEPKGRND